MSATEGAASHRRGWAALIAVYLLWGSTYAAIQVSERQIPPLLMAGCRFLLAGLLLYLLVGRRGGWRGSPREWLRPRPKEMVAALLAGCLLLVGGNGLVTVAELQVHSGLAALVVATVPLWMALIALGSGTADRPGWLSWLGVLLGLGGVAVLADPRAGGHLPPLPALALVLAAIAWAAGSYYARGSSFRSNVLLAAALEMLAAGAVMLILGLVSGELGQLHLARIGLPAFLAFAWLVLGGAIFGYSCYGYALVTLPPTTVATYAYVNPVVALLLGWLLLGQGLTPAVGLAALLITLGVVLMVSGPALRRRRARARLAAAGPG